MEVKKIVEGMTAPQVAQVIDENFNALNGEKATVEAVADVQKNVNRSDDNTGILSYPVFDDTEPVAVGDVRRYEGLLYRAKEAGAYDWDPEKWERVTLKQLEDEKLSELGSEVNDLGSDVLDLISSELEKNELEFVEQIKGAYVRHDSQKLEIVESYSTNVYKVQSGEALNISGNIPLTQYFGVIGFSSDLERSDFKVISPNGLNDINMNVFVPKNAKYAYITHDLLKGLKLSIKNIPAKEEVDQIKNLSSDNKESINNINIKLNGTIQNYIDGKSLNISGELSDDANWIVTDFIEFSKGDEFSKNVPVVASSITTCVYDINKNFINWIDAEGYEGMHYVTIDIENCAYLRTCIPLSFKDTAVLKNGEIVWKAVDTVKGVSTLVKEIRDNRVSEVNELSTDEQYISAKLFYEHGEKLINGTTVNFKTGYIHAGGGFIEKNEGWVYSEEYIPCVKGDVVEWNVGGMHGTVCLAMYDVYYNFITWADIPNFSSKLTITIKNELCRYVRASYSVENLKDAYLKINGVFKWLPVFEFIGLEGRVSYIENEMKSIGLLNNPNHNIGIPRNAMIKPSTAKLIYKSYNPLTTGEETSDIREEVDAFQIFGYYGNAYRVIWPSLGYQYYIETKKELLNVKGVKKLWINLELKNESENGFIDIYALKNDTEQISETIYSHLLVKDVVSVVSMELDLSDVGDNDSFGIRIMSRAAAPNMEGKTLCIGRISIWDYDNKSLEKKDGNLYGVKLVTLGDSITAMQTWQQFVCEKLGCYYSRVEVDNGKTIDGEFRKQTAVGGSSYWPFSDSSIYARANDVQFYNGDIIIMECVNDVRIGFNFSDAMGTIDDTPYEGDIVNESEYADYINQKKSGNYSPNELFDSITYYSVVKGIMKKLVENQPKSKVYAFLGMKINKSSFYSLQKKMNEVVKECADFYSIPVIDCFSESGINYNNQSTYMMSDNVHPVEEGGRRIAECVINTISNFIKLP